MVQWHIGCSGFHYKHWRDIFYPAGLAVSKWFGYYCENFKTLELNVTFYRFPRVADLEKWYANSPDDFSFSLKVPKAITHYKQFNDVERMLGDVYNAATLGLRDKLGPILFQLPPRTKYTPERLQKILANMNPAFTNVLEFRNETWWNADVFKELKARNVIFCGMSHPDLPDDIVTNQSTVYHRYHGRPHLYASPYSKVELQEGVQKITDAGIVDKAFIYFNNDIGGSAIVNAKTMQHIAMPGRPKKVS